MAKLPVVSGQEVVKILTKHFGFVAERQKGSHVCLKKNHVFTAVPMHPYLKKGTLNAILKQAEIIRDEFMKYI